MVLPALALALVPALALAPPVGLVLSPTPGVGVAGRVTPVLVGLVLGAGCVALSGVLLLFPRLCVRPLEPTVNIEPCVDALGGELGMLAPLLALVFALAFALALALANPMIVVPV